MIFQHFPCLFSTNIPHYRLFKPLPGKERRRWAVEHDVPCPKEEYEAMYEKAREPKKLVVLPGLRHYDVYSGPGAETTSGLAIDWHHEHL